MKALGMDMAKAILAAAIIGAFAWITAVSNRMTAIETKLDERQRVLDKALDRIEAHLSGLDERIRELERGPRKMVGGVVEHYEGSLVELTKDKIVLGKGSDRRTFKIGDKAQYFVGNHQVRSLPPLQPGQWIIVEWLSDDPDLALRIEKK
jgi:hypothetical protein